MSWTNFLSSNKKIRLNYHFELIKLWNFMYFSQNKISTKANKVSENSKSSKKLLHSTIRFPWWFKIIAYIISFIFASVSLFFVAIKGITFGNEKVSKWLTSVVISFFSSILFTQPLQVNFDFRYSLV